MDFVYRFPVVKGIQAEKEYYIGKRLNFRR